MAANQDLIMQIVTEGYGFDIDEINSAIKALGNEAYKESVIAFLFEARHMKEKRKSESKGQSTGNNDSGGGLISGIDSNNSKSKTKSKSNVNSISNGIKGIDINSGGQTLQQTTFDPSVENISGKAATQNVKQMLLDQAKQRQKEKEELAKKNEQYAKEQMEIAKKKEFEQREHEKKVELQRQKIKAKRAQTSTKKKKNHSAFLQKQAKYINEVQQVESDMKALDDNRAEKEEKINTPEQAIDAMVKEYGKDEAGQKLMYIRRLLLKILNGPKDLNNALNRQLRTFDYKDQSVLVNIVTPFGPKIFLQTIGFEERQLVKNKNDPLFREEHTLLLLPNKKFDIKNIENAFNILNKFLEITSLNIHSIIYKECFKKEEISANSLFYGSWLLYTAMINTMREPEAEMPRAIDKVAFPNSVLESKTFTNLIQTLGFKEHNLAKGIKFKLHYGIDKNTGKWIVKPFSDKGMRMLLVNSERLYDVLALLLPFTTLGSAVNSLIINNCKNDKNKKTRINKFLRSTLNFVTKRMNESLDISKNHIDLKKIKEKCSNILDENGNENGIENLLLLLDFEKPDAHGIMYSVNTSKKNIGMAQIQRKQRIFEFAVNYYTSINV